MAAARKPSATGRADRIRAHLVAANRPLTARQILEAVEPTGDVCNMHGSLSTLVRGGHIERRTLEGRVYFVIAGTALPAPANDDVATTASARIRQYMATAGRPVTAREVTDNVLPEKGIRIVSAMIGSMVKKGLLVRHETLTRACTYTLGREAHHWGSPRLPKKARPRPARAPQPEPPKPKKAAALKPARAPRAAKAPKPPAAPKPARVLRGPTLTERDVPRRMAPAAPLPTRTRRAAPPACAMHGIPDANRAASDRLAADIAAFKARGGKIERLGTTQFFKHIGMEAANHVPPRTPRTGTTDLDD